jgi:hypothetical protein
MWGERSEVGVAELCAQAPWGGLGEASSVPFDPLRANGMQGFDTLSPNRALRPYVPKRRVLGM